MPITPLYEETSQARATLLNDSTPREIITRLGEAQSKMMRLKGLLKTLLAMKRMAKVANNKNLQDEVN